jgi:hypothetical protein
MLITHHTCHRGMWIMCYIEDGWKLTFEWIIADPCVFPKSDLSPMKDPQDKVISLIFINHLQKWKSYGFACTWVCVFERRYLFLSKVYQVPSILRKFTIHLLRMQIFWISRSIILGRHKMPHFARRYFFLSVSP